MVLPCLEEKPPTRAKLCRFAAFFGQWWVSGHILIPQKGQQVCSDDIDSRLSSQLGIDLALHMSGHCLRHFAEVWNQRVSAIQVIHRDLRVDTLQILSYRDRPFIDIVKLITLPTSSLGLRSRLS